MQPSGTVGGRMLASLARLCAVPVYTGLLYAALTLIAFQYIGDLITDAFALAIPGVVIGLLLLLSALGLLRWWNGQKCEVPDALNRVAKALHEHFGLLFVPAGAGIVDSFDRLAGHVLPLLAAVALSTAATIAVTALVVAARPGEVPIGDPATVE